MGKEIADWIKQTRQLNRMTQTDLAKYLGISLGAVYKYESNKMVPGASIYQKLQQLENKTSKDSGPEEKEDTSMHEFAMQLAKEKIESQANKILALEKQLSNQPVHLTNGKIPSWSDVIFDVKTKQTYKAGRYDTFEKYEMNGYQDFYKKLGYSELEAEKYWKRQHEFMTLGVSSRGTNYNEIETMGFKMNPDKTDKSITDPKETQRHFEMAIKNNIINQLQVYNSCYVGKDGNEILAIISVLFDFITYQSESKIKFINI